MLRSVSVKIAAAFWLEDLPCRDPVCRDRLFTDPACKDPACRDTACRDLVPQRPASTQSLWKSKSPSFLTDLLQEGFLF